MEVIQLWIKDSKSLPIFWLVGPAGVGKSAIAQMVVEWCDERGQLASSFFCSQDANHHHTDFCPIFPTLAIQLAQKHLRIRLVLVSLLRSDPDVVYESPSDQVEQLIVKPLKLVDVSTVIIIDGLDEWMDDESQFTVVSTIEHWVKEIPKVKFLVTSRPKHNIFVGPDILFCTQLFMLTPDLIDSDIRRFLEHELSRLASRNRLDGWPMATQLDLLCHRAAGLFVYAVATVKFLGRKHTSPDKQYTIIEHSPDDTIHEGTVEGVHRGLSLDSLCTSILQSSIRANDAGDDAVVRLVLATVFLVAHPLPPPAIATLIHLDVEKVASIIRSIEPLLRIHEAPEAEEPVRPFHKLLPDLLTSPDRCADKRFYISPGKFHSEIALNCLKLVNETLQGDPSVGSEVNSPEKIALGYACRSWHVHLAETREGITVLIPTLRHFLEHKYGAWLGMLSILGATGVAASALDKTISWLCDVRLGLP